MSLGTSMHQVACGRLFVRGAAATPHHFSSAPATRYRDAKLLVGVIELPVAVEIERLHQVRLNSYLWMDIASSMRTDIDPSHLRETTISGVLTGQRWRTHGLDDSFDVFVRASLIPHEKRHLRWAIIAGAIAQPLPALPREGLYAFDGKTKRFDFVSPEIYAGCGLDNIIRETIWGPGGKWGMSTSMDPDFFPKWLQAERDRTQRREPEFALFRQKMQERMPLELHVYDAPYRAERDRVAKTVMLEIMHDPETNPRLRELKQMHAQVTRRPAP